MESEQSQEAISPSALQAYKKQVEDAWFAITGLHQVDCIIQDGKVYIPVNTVCRGIMAFRMRIIRLGLSKLTAISTRDVTHLLEYLTRQFALLNCFMRKK